MIHGHVGNDAFWSAVREYVRRFDHDLVTTQDFVRTVFDETGVNVEGLVEQWVEAGGYPIYEVSFKVRENDVAVRVRQGQKLDEVVPLFDMPVDVDLYFASGVRKRHTVRVRERQADFYLPLDGEPSELVDLVFDPECRVLCDIELEKSLSMWIHQSRLETNAAIRWRALNELRGQARSKSARTAILRVLLGSPEPLLRERAARLCDFRDGRAWVALVDAATQDPAARVRREAAHTLLQHSLRVNFDPNGPEYARLLAHLGEESSPAVRAKLMELLGLEP